mmetsp:Transcript_53481/g.116180  ORF Transcript_53481/g.116180 Transcript_53481/m.116180 type:complete len:101 (-) Transcript_53481:586-888(-)
MQPRYTQPTLARRPSTLGHLPSPTDLAPYSPPTDVPFTCLTCDQERLDRLARTEEQATRLLTSLESTHNSTVSPLAEFLDRELAIRGALDVDQSLEEMTA